MACSRSRGAACWRTERVPSSGCATLACGTHPLQRAATPGVFCARSAATPAARRRAHAATCRLRLAGPRRRLLTGRDWAHAGPGCSGAVPLLRRHSQTLTVALRVISLCQRAYADVPGAVADAAAVANALLSRRVSYTVTRSGNLASAGTLGHAKHVHVGANDSLAQQYQRREPLFCAHWARTRWLLALTGQAW